MKLLQMLEVTTVGSHRDGGSQVLGEVCHRLIDFMAALPRWHAKRRSTHQSYWASAGVYGTFPHGAPA